MKFPIKKLLIIPSLGLWAFLALLFYTLLYNNELEFAEMLAYLFIIPILITTIYYGKIWGLLIALLSSIVVAFLLFRQDVQFSSFLSQRVMFQIIFFNIFTIVTGSLNEELKNAKDNLEEKVRDRTEKLEKAYLQLQELDTKKDQFISIAAHELKTPLTSIKGFTQLLLDDQNKNNPINSEEIHHFLELILENSERLNNLAIDLIDSTKFSLEKMKITTTPIEVTPIFNDIKENFEFILQENALHTKFSCEPNLKVLANPSRVRQILRNLLANAKKYTPENGTITLTIGTMRNKNINDVNTQKRKEVLFCITDTGYGIPKEKQDSIFERFYQVQDPFQNNMEGSGLGLSICKNLVETMGGRIWFESEIGKGSSFYFTLPLVKE
ncbi:MAG: sensor histidine kinase [Promethearchaeota archaeon]